MRWLLGMMAVVAMLSSSLSAGVLTLSDVSNTATDPALLDATLTFEVTGNTLSLEISNDTSDPNGYQITEVYFNVTSDVANLSLNTPPMGFGDWELVGAGGMGDPTFVTQFGTFDYVLRWTGDRNVQIDALDYVDPPVTFTMTITPSNGTVTQDDFVTDVSIPDGNNPAAFAAIHFEDGPDSDDTFGAIVIPEASSILTFAMVGSVFGMVCVRRRRS